MPKKLNLVIVFAFVIIAASLLTGCYSPTVVAEYDTAGNKIKVTECDESAVKSIVTATKDKTLIVWKSGWAAYVSGSMATTEDPTPTCKAYAGKVDGGYISIKEGDEDKINWDGVAKVISATNKSLSVSTDGVSESNSDTKTSARVGNLRKPSQNIPATIKRGK